MSATHPVFTALPMPWQEESLAEGLDQICGHYGFSHYAVVTIPAAEEGKVEMKLLLSNWTPRFRRAFERLGLARFTPVVRSLLSDPQPLAWDVEFLYGALPGEVSPAADLFVKEGVAGGVYVPVYGFGAMEGALSFFGPRADLSDRELGELQIIAFTVIGIFAAIRFEENRRNNPLTVRERECLRLAMLGKTSSEIGRMLAISEHTVSQHMNASVRKLNCANRTQAVAMAAQLGYLS
ncbi:helix-turn-helix transcriptional regulator [Consotaella salsifontis]|uniref:DNA-binding transcriptional regulator, CsgD family n=1 Tax=Consotaella salsifontis TaxID=1365950 RepID=A0A1T4T521_9HYPH|nr:LuxR family transcriptional regulator [Consotaella salsifontis]SKA35409.1 DNA-binding transcriptional regulator, CsgD family [Consotaella salsifontis]